MHELVEAIASALEGSGEYAEVRRHHLIGPGPSGLPRASVGLAGFAAEDVAGEDLVTTASFSVLLTVEQVPSRDLDHLPELDRLALLARRLLHHSDLGGLCVPGGTYVRAGRYESSGISEASVGLTLSAQVLEDPAAWEAP